jgi:hypothetical protein
VGTGNIPEGNMLHADDSGRKHPALQRHEICSPPAMRATSLTACLPCRIASGLVANRSPTPRSRIAVRGNLFSVNFQKCHRCALATRKSRNTWIRATALSSSG